MTGHPTVVVAYTYLPLFAIIPNALHQTGYSGWAPDNWELRDAQGTLLNTDVAIAKWNFPLDVQLFLNLKAGIGD